MPTTTPSVTAGYSHPVMAGEGRPSTTSLRAVSDVVHGPPSPTTTPKRRILFRIV